MVPIYGDTLKDISDFIGPSDTWVPVLNGFSLQTLPGYKADKLFFLGLKLFIRSDSNRHKIGADVHLVMGCSTLECEPFNQEVGYLIEVKALVIKGGKWEYLPFETFDLFGMKKKHAWTRDSLNSAQWDHWGSWTPPKDTIRLPVFTGFKIALNDEHHFYRLALASELYNPILTNVPGMLHWRTHAIFQQWGHGMYAAYDQNFQSQFRIPSRQATLRKPGQATITKKIIQLVVPNGNLYPGWSYATAKYETSHRRQQDPGQAKTGKVETILQPGTK